MILVASVLIFVAVVTVIVGTSVVWTRSERLRARLAGASSAAPQADLLKSDAATKPSALDRVIRRSALIDQLAALSEQAGSAQSPTDLCLLVAVFALLGGLGGWFRIGTAGGTIIAAVVGSSLPVLHLLYRRHARRHKFQAQFADAVDMMSRSIRAGNALTAAIQLVGDEMADPVGAEFRKLSEEIRLGMDPGEGLSRLQARIPTEDVRFFCTAVKIQRGSGGNLAEVLDRLSDVIRKRFELLSHARVLSAQQRFAAIFVGLSPVGFSIIFYVLSPDYFEPLIGSPIAPTLIGAGLVLETIGFLVIWRIARIKV